MLKEIDVKIAKLESEKPIFEKNEVEKGKIDQKILALDKFKQLLQDEHKKMINKEDRYGFYPGREHEIFVEHAIQHINKAEQNHTAVSEYRDRDPVSAFFRKLANTIKSWFNVAPNQTETASIFNSLKNKLTSIKTEATVNISNGDSKIQEETNNQTKSF